MAEKLSLIALFSTLFSVSSEGFCVLFSPILKSVTPGLLFRESMEGPPEVELPG